MEIRRTSAALARWHGLALAACLSVVSTGARTVSHEDAAPANVTRLSGRLARADGQPFAKQDVEYAIVRQGQWRKVEWFVNPSGALTTDPGGRFHIEITSADLPPDAYTFGVWEHCAAPHALTKYGCSADIDALHAAHDIVVGRQPRELDLGDVVLRSARTTEHWRELSDDALHDALDRASRTSSFELLETADRNGILLEVMRRGGATWERWLGTRAFTRFPDRRVITGPVVADARTPRDLDELTILRRLQQRADPVVVELECEPEFVATFADDIVLPVRLRNAETETHVCCEQPEWFDLDRHGRWRIEITPAAGVRRIERHTPVVAIDGTAQLLILAPGESASFRIPLREQIEIDRPGTYTLRVLHHDALPIVDCASVAHLVTSAAPEIRLRMEPLTIELTHAELDEARRLVAAIDTHVPPLLVRPAVSGGMTATPQTDTDAAMRVIALGWKALPALLERLADANDTPARRAWTFALLHDVTGALDPTEDASWTGALGTFSRRTLEVDGTYRDHVVEFREPRVEAQALLTARWRARSALFATKIVE